ncbi:MAG: glycerophosphodiester phosphodiesterase family protein, partial [Pseudomonadota bacterium]
MPFFSIARSFAARAAATALLAASIAAPAHAQLLNGPLPGEAGPSSPASKVPNVELRQDLFIVAHRGGAGLFPENTLPAVRNALALGVDAIEIDVQLTKDGELVAYHDLELNPATTQAPYDEWLVKPGPAIKDLTYEELEVYDVGGVDPRSDLAQKYPDQQRVEETQAPLVREVIRTIIEEGTGGERLWVEIKTDPTKPELSSSSVATAEAVVKLLREEGFLARADIMSFDWNALDRVKALHPISRRVYLTMSPKWLRAETSALSAAEVRRMWWAGVDIDAFGGSVPKAIASKGGLVWAPFHGDLDGASVAEAERLGLTVSAWTVNDLGRMQQMLALGVDS